MTHSLENVSLENSMRFGIFFLKLSITLNIHAVCAKNVSARLLSFLEELTFHRYMLSSDNAYLPIAYHGKVTVNASSSHQHESWYESPLCTSKKITLTHKHIFKINTQTVGDCTLMQVRQIFKCVFLCL